MKTANAICLFPQRRSLLTRQLSSAASSKQLYWLSTPKKIWLAARLSVTVKLFFPKRSAINHIVMIEPKYPLEPKNLFSRTRNHGLFRLPGL